MRHPLADVLVSTALVAAQIPTTHAGAQPGASPPGPTILSDGRTVILRAIRPDLPRELIEYVAAYAEPLRLNATAFPDAPSLTALEVIDALCGSSSPDYLRLVRDRNALGESFDPTAPLGPRARELSWPACFYVARESVDRVVERDETASDLYLALTGSSGTPESWRAFFSASRVPDIHRVAEGEILRGKYETRASMFTTRGTDPATFVARVREIAERIYGSHKEALNLGPSPQPVVSEGQIILSASPPDGCPATQQAPFSARAVEDAFRLSPTDGEKVHVIVGDNGFFGARLTNGILQFEARFPRKFFNVRRIPPALEENVGPLVPLSDTVKLNPLNRQNLPDVEEPDSTSGHGTHVAGLVLGGTTAIMDGPIFATVNDDPSWLQLTIVPLARGERALSQIALSGLGDFPTYLQLQNASIYNLSVKYGLPSQHNFLKLVKDDTKLFVVAAGNDHEDVIAKDVFPAVLGGDKQDNVITVAAEDGAGYLAGYSNLNEDRVDLAALGCGVESWLDGINAVPLSGTSQAAPLVTFTAALLDRKGLAPAQIKRRIVASGDLLLGRRTGTPDRIETVQYGDNDAVPVRSRSRLNMRKALYIGRDYIRFRRGEVEIEALGTLNGASAANLQGRCGNVPLHMRDILAAKRAGFGRSLYCFGKSSRKAERFQFIGGPSRLKFRAVRFIEIDGMSRDPLPQEEVSLEFELEDLQELIRSEEQMRIIEGGI